MANKTVVLLAFLTGVAIGANWGKIRKHLKPYLGAMEGASAKGLHGLMGVFMSAKEHVEDLFAAAETKKTKNKPRTRAARKRTTRRRKTPAGTATKG